MGDHLRLKPSWQELDNEWSWRCAGGRAQRSSRDYQQAFQRLWSISGRRLPDVTVCVIRFGSGESVPLTIGTGAHAEMRPEAPRKVVGIRPARLLANACN